MLVGYLFGSSLLFSLSSVSVLNFSLHISHLNFFLLKKSNFIDFPPHDYPPHDYFPPHDYKISLLFRAHIRHQVTLISTL